MTKFKFVTDSTMHRVGLLAKKCQSLKDKAAQIPEDTRQELSLMFAATFSSFVEFAELGMVYLGFSLSDIQEDIAQFMQQGLSKCMVQAQRGQAKSTLAALYCVWLLIIKPTRRVLIVSGGERQASDVAFLIIRIIQNWSILCWMRPDPTKGDRTSVSGFDIHYTLKGVDKSPSVSCVGITANLQGMRADFVLADDVETQRNSMTQTEREKLALLIKEFDAICISGSIMYLGTPQTKDSIYRLLPSRGYKVRVWCGRYPTNEELERYGAGVEIAPKIMEALIANPELQSGGGIEGNRGQPTDPEHITEHILQEKELSYGTEGFSLQYMLDTTLSDELRTRIKLIDIPIIGCGYTDVPETLHWLVQPNKGLLPSDSTDYTKIHQLYYASAVSDVFIPLKHKLMALDPSGSGGDELAFAIGGATNSFIYLLSVGGFRGGTSPENMNRVILKLIDTDTKVLDIEKNMGHGTVGLLFQSHIRTLKTELEQHVPTVDKFLDSSKLGRRELIDFLGSIAITEYHVVGQKEKRIIDTISPVTRRHKLVMTTNCLKDDFMYCQEQPMEKREGFSILYQLSSITYDRGSLVHDDRADCVQRVVEACKGYLSIDAVKAAQKRDEEERKNWLRNPMGYSSSVLKQGTGASKATRTRRQATPRRR